MRNSCKLLGIMTLLLFPNLTLQAGLYLPAIPTQGPEVSSQGVKAIPFTQFRRDVLEDLLRIGNPQPPESKMRQQYLKAQDNLAAKGRRGTLADEDRVNLSGCQIRLRQYQEAIDLLTPIATRDCRNFMVFSNLATAEQLAGHLERAISHLEQTLDIWPSEWPGMTPEQLRWYRQADKYQLILLRHRWNNARRSQQITPALDPLFSKNGQPVRYVGENGKYEAGKIAIGERDKLPADAIAIIEQLLIWLPDDVHLYWQLGELLNAAGDVSSAATVFEDCEWKRRLNALELRQHRQIVAEAAENVEKTTVIEETNESSANTTAISWLPNRTKLWTAALVFAGIVVILTIFQIREIRRRRSGPTIQH
jgi:tetratricopeptide (TPR) repeat protein